ncbi:MAG: aldose 1-epimerase family protein [Bacteroidaceae bacterium]|nr:aldose 1-epimerase family protein [Bacteroidaceae bacterium]
MEHILSNGILEAVISDLGAEIRNLRRVTAPTEYIWQGDPDYWTGRAPLLFPIVGSLWNGEALIDGNTYQIRKHGFARDMVFRKTADEDRHMAFAIEANEETRTCFPHDFVLTVDYRLLRNVLTVGWTVTNRSDSPMSFNIGGHPAFAYPKFKAEENIHGYMSFDKRQKIDNTRLAEGGYATRETEPIEFDADELLPLTNDTFDCGSILDATDQIHRITLHTKDGRPWVTVKHNMPVTALWSPRNGKAPFVCIEPWQGCCDYEGYDGDFARRPFTISLPPGGTWESSYQIIAEF